MIPIRNIPTVKPGDNIACLIVDALEKNNQHLTEGDILCVASKILSISENKYTNLNEVIVGKQAQELQKTIPKKDPRILELILKQANYKTENLRINGSWIGAKNHIGRVLTSSGIDKVDDDTVLELPDSCDDSAKNIGEHLSTVFDLDVGVIITDSDGREGIAGATQICVGLYGVPPLRERFDTQETACDMIAASAGLVMGQRGNRIPAVIVRGYFYVFDGSVKLNDAF